MKVIDVFPFLRYNPAYLPGAACADGSAEAVFAGQPQTPNLKMREETLHPYILNSKP